MARLQCPKCSFPRKDGETGRYTPGKSCDRCGYREKPRTLPARPHAFVGTQVRVTVRKLAGRSHFVDVDLNVVDHDLQLHFPDGGILEISITPRIDGYIDIRSYSGRLLLQPVAGNAIALRPEVRKCLRVKVKRDGH